MDAEKQSSLEAKGWKFGNAEEFLDMSTEPVTDSNALAAVELNTPYFLEQDGTIRNGQNEIVTEIVYEATAYKEIHSVRESA